MLFTPSTKLAAAAGLLLSLVASGCAQVSSIPPPAPPVGKTERWYVAFGDSITAGYRLANTIYGAYPAQAGQVMRTGVNDVGVGGDQACDVVTRQIFNNGISPTITLPTHYSLLIGTNDANYKNVGAYEAVFNSCHRAAIAWLALPNEYKVLGPFATYSGAAIENSPWYACSTNTAGGVCNFAFTTAKPTTVYVWVRLTDGNAGVGNISLDGTVVQSVTSAPTPTISTQNGITTGATLIRIPQVAAGAHTITATQTSSTGNVATLAVGWIPPTGSAGVFSDVTVGTVPFQAPVNTGGFNTPNAICQGASDSICQAYIADIRANVALLQGDGLDVRLWDTRQTMFASTAEMADALHPGPLGQTNLMRGMLDVMRPGTIAAPTNIVNIMDQTAVTANAIVNSSTGALITSFANYTATDFMNLRGANSFQANVGFGTYKAGPAGVAFYDANKTFIGSNVNGWTNFFSGAQILVPAGAVYARGWFPSSVTLSTVMVVTGPTMPATYLPYTPASSN